ncbi:MAG TPA: hypothetical protein PLA43_21380 [Bryobacteraceae bacterium]|nr:hypothetical protein [Bryobacteraceae bacterium]
MLYQLLLFAALQNAPPAPDADVIVERMMRADDIRRAALAGYTGMRRYRVENRRFNKRAEVTVRVSCQQAGAKTFEVVDESGSGFIRRRVIRKMLDAEREASTKGEREETRITPRNYDFFLVGTDITDGRSSYVLDIVPKTANRFLVRGRIWVDADEYAITRIEGSPAKNPSFWTSKIQVVHRYEKVGTFWLPVLNQSRAEVRIFGPTEVTIEYFDYATKEEPAQAEKYAAVEASR